MTRFLVQGVEPGEKRSQDSVRASRGFVPWDLLNDNVSSVIHEMQSQLRDEDGFAPFRVEILVLP